MAPRITWRREYRLYYWLALLDGSRMQIYFAFAPFVLVEHFNVNAKQIIVVLIIASLIKWRTGAFIGQLVDRFGEKQMLTAGYCLHLTVFLGFALAPNVWFAYLCYIGYNFLSLFSIGTTTYLKKICRREDLAPSLAMGVSLSHFTAIVVPLLSPITFYLVVVNLVFAFFNSFGVIHAVTKGGPGNATEIMVFKLWQDGFIGLNLGSSAAQSVILMAVVIVLTALQFKIAERKVTY